MCSKLWSSRNWPFKASKYMYMYCVHTKIYKYQKKQSCESFPSHFFLELFSFLFSCRKMYIQARQYRCISIYVILENDLYVLCTQSIFLTIDMPFSFNKNVLLIRNIFRIFIANVCKGVCICILLYIVCILYIVKLQFFFLLFIIQSILYQSFSAAQTKKSSFLA